MERETIIIFSICKPKEMLSVNSNQFNTKTHYIFFYITAHSINMYLSNINIEKHILTLTFRWAAIGTLLEWRCVTRTVCGAACVATRPSEDLQTCTASTRSPIPTSFTSLWGLQGRAQVQPDIQSNFWWIYSLLLNMTYWWKQDTGLFLEICDK